MKESKRWQDILIGAGIFAAATFIIAGVVRPGVRDLYASPGLSL